MKDVYSGAYCTIAATAAVDSLSGFLDQHLQVPTEYVCVQDGAEKQLFVSTDVDDFDHHILEAPLNKRAWVFQESALSRRIIHFSADQMYWECGEGIYCENLTRLTSRSTYRYFMMDPEFPARISRILNGSVVGNDSTTTAFETSVLFLFEEYSKRHLTFAEDRPIAIAGLEQRVAEAFHCESRFGVFDIHLHRNLMWEPSGERAVETEGRLTIPSWSWMSYPGAIDFQQGLSSLNFELGSNWEKFKDLFEILKDGRRVVDVNVNVTFRPGIKNELNADLAALVQCKIDYPNDSKSHPDSTGADYVLHSMSGVWKGTSRRDTRSTSDCDNMFCVVLARLRGKLPGGQGTNSFYIFLLVAPTGEHNEYRRIGLGFAERSCIMKLGSDVRIV